MEVKQFFLFIFVGIVFDSCAYLDNEHLQFKEDTRIRMSVSDFQNGDVPTTRSILTPTSSGSSFSWVENDVVAVYSSSKGMTNFIIDNENISEDGLSAEFYGSGFTLTPNSQYYAFYPYSKASTDKTAIPVSYEGQQMLLNGDFHSLGNYDYMYAYGVADENSHSSFLFYHIGCLVEFQIISPATARYTSVRFEIDNPTTDNYLIRSGIVDITGKSPSIIPNTYVNNSVFIVNLGDNGIKVENNSLLTVYMMLPPQNLEGKNLCVRLLDSEQKWYTVNVEGKNMRAGYTYHYSINSSGNGFTGVGQGLPDDEFNAEYVSTYKNPNPSSYEWFLYDNHFLYATGPFGLRKISYENDYSPFLINESSIDMGPSQKGRAMVLDEDIIYVGIRQNTGGKEELYKPQLSFTFETNLKSCSSNSEISDNDIVNRFLKKMRLKSVCPDDIDEVLVYKAKFEGGIYKNVIQLRKSGNYVGNLYRETFDTREQALSALPKTYTNAEGDMVELDWSVIQENVSNHLYCTLFTYGEFDYFEATGSASFDETATGSPNNLGYSARFKTTKATDNTAQLKYYIDIMGGELSFMMKMNCLPTQEVKIPLFSKGNNNRVLLSLSPNNDRITLALIVDGVKYSSSKSININEWHNIKLHVSSDNISAWIREIECGNWERLILTNTNSDISYDAICIGILSEANNVELLIDDLYYDKVDLDRVSYVNGALSIVNKNTMSVINKYNYDYKVCGVSKIQERLIVTFLNGFNVYNTENPSSPRLLYTYRPKEWTEYQGVDCFEKDGRTYAIVCTYNKGFIIIDLTEENNISIVKSFDFTTISGDNPLTQGSCYSFDVVVDFPFAYATVSTKHNYIGSSSDHRGIVSIDLNNLYNPSMKFVEIPKERISLIKSGDPTPTRITKCGNKIIVNNCDYGVEIFNTSTNGIVTYLSGLAMLEQCTSNAIFSTSNGLLFIGDIGTKGFLYLYKGLR